MNSEILWNIFFTGKFQGKLRDKINLFTISKIFYFLISASLDYLHDEWGGGLNFPIPQNEKVILGKRENPFPPFPPF
jgi:hypothetical protein